MAKQVEFRYQGVTNATRFAMQFELDGENLTIDYDTVEKVCELRRTGGILQIYKLISETYNKSYTQAKNIYKEMERRRFRVAVNYDSVTVDIDFDSMTDEELLEIYDRYLSTLSQPYA